jgi:hypothetical protein
MARDSFAGMVLPADLTLVELVNLDREAVRLFYSSVLASRGAKTTIQFMTEDLRWIQIEWLGHRYQVAGERTLRGGYDTTIKRIERTHQIATDEDGNDTWIEFEKERPQGWGEW